jgi:hypothetical protein
MCAMKTEEITVKNWEEYIALTGQLDGWAFRGQQNSTWELLSSLSRYLAAYVTDLSSWKTREERAIRIFRRKAHNYLTNPSVLSNDLRCLALMQHHGAPTRLLDFTKSPFVAAFFALETATSDAAVFALNTPVLWTSNPLDHPGLDRDTIDPRMNGNFEKYFLKNENEIIWIGEPTEMDQRLIAQSGTMIVPGALGKSISAILENYNTKEPVIRKLILPLHVRDDAMKSLYRMNITNATLFPDLDGLAKSIRLELEVVWPGFGGNF